jgi:hypothetical protein
MEPDEEEAIRTQDAYPVAEDPMSSSMQGGDNSGATPVMGGGIVGGDNSGGPAIPAPAMGAIDTGEGGTPDPSLMKNSYGPLAGPARGVKSIISYLMGADAMPPEALDGAGKTVDPQGRMNPSERNLMALQHARDNGGDEAAWALMQTNRVSYNAQTAFAKTALEGTAQKPADLMAAIDAANKAQANVLDGSNVEFRPLQGGQAITATVTRPGAPPDQLVLSPQQFAKWLDVGGDGQWDKIMSSGAQQTLHKIVNEGPSRGSKSLGDMPPMPGQRPQRQPAAAPPVDNSESDAYNPSAAENAPKSNFGKTPSSLNLSGSDERSTPVPDQTNYGPELEARAMRMFPSVSQEAERNQWMAGEEARSEGNQVKIDVAAETGKRKEDVARVTAGGKTEAEKIKAAGALEKTKEHNKGWQFASEAKAKAAAAMVNQRAQEMLHRDANSAQGRHLKLISSKMATLQPLTEDEKKAADAMGVQGMQAAEVTRPQQQQQQQTAPQQRPAASHANRSPGPPPVQGAKFFNGSWYTRGPNGESVPVRQ